MVSLNRLRTVYWLALVLLLLPATAWTDIVTYQYRVVASYPHDTGVFTQGLIYRDGALYESAGQYGESRLLKRTLTDSTPYREHRLPPALFAEGITLLNGRIYQLTWRSHHGFIYDQETLTPLGEFGFSGEGWGLTDNGQHLIVSDGTDRLSFIDPTGFKVIRTIDVRLNGKPVYRLNELEWIDGKLYANIWQTNWIIIIDPESGAVEGRVRLHDILPKELRTRKTDVLNGIAYDREKRRLLVTGKYWPRLYHIELTPDARMNDIP